MNLDAQTRALLDLVEADRARQVATILEDAHSRAALLRAQAHAEARKRMRQAFAEQRALRHDRIAAAQARLATQRRLHAQQRTAALLRLAWEQLPGELEQRWRDPAARATWVAKVIAAAMARLAHTAAWHIVHAPDWPAAEQQALARALVAKSAPAPVFEADAGIRAGLKIMVDGNRIDGTLAGLLAERGDFEARLLRQLESCS
ncbi:MAG: hypothetical protein ACRC2B_02675 [Rubrivivax sp.]